HTHTRGSAVRRGVLNIQPDLARRRRPNSKERLFRSVDRAQRFCRNYTVCRMRKLIRCLHWVIPLAHAKKPESDNFRLRPPIYVSIFLSCLGKAPRPFPTRAYLKHKGSKGQRIEALPSTGADSVP